MSEQTGRISKCGLHDFFRGKPVLITGHTGFKGSWLTLWLSSLGALVTGFSLPPPTDPSHFQLSSMKNLVNHVEGDIRNLPQLIDVFNAAKPEIVFHLAAQAIVRESYADPKSTFDINVGGTVNVLEAVRHCGSVRAVIIVTSDKCYENNEWIWGYRESDALGGADPYSASKGAAEIICASYRRSFFQSSEDSSPGIASVRAGNVIGGGDWAKDRIIPDIVRALLQETELTLRNPNAIRPWQHVLEPLSGYLHLSSRLYNDPEHFSGPWNFGPDKVGNTTVGELVTTFSELWHKGNDDYLSTRHVPANQHEAGFLYLSIEKALYQLQWRPVLDIDTALDWTVAWYKAWQNGPGTIADISQRQINEYTDMALRSKVAWACKEVA